MNTPFLQLSKKFLSDKESLKYAFDLRIAACYTEPMK